MATVIHFQGNINRATLSVARANARSTVHGYMHRQTKKEIKECAGPFLKNVRQNEQRFKNKKGNISFANYFLACHFSKRNFQSWKYLRLDRTLRLCSLNRISFAPTHSLSKFDLCLRIYAGWTLRFVRVLSLPFVHLPFHFLEPNVDSAGIVQPFHSIHATFGRFILSVQYQLFSFCGLFLKIVTLFVIMVGKIVRYGDKIETESIRIVYCFKVRLFAISLYLRHNRSMYVKKRVQCSY